MFPYNNQYGPEYSDGKAHRPNYFHFCWATFIAIIPPPLRPLSPEEQIPPPQCDLH